MSRALRTFACLVALALAVRLGWAIIHKTLQTQTPSHGDEPVFINIASNLATAANFSQNGEVPTAQRPPGYPLFLAAVFLLSGKSLLAARVVNILLSSLTVGILYLSGLRLFDQRAAVTAGLMAAVFPSFVTYPALILSEPLFFFLVSLLLLFSVTRTDSLTTLRFAFGSGLLAGFAILTRSEFLLFLPFWMVGILVAATPKGVALRSALVIGGTAVFCVAPWMARNYAQFHRFTLSLNLGPVLRGVYNAETFSNPSLMGDWFHPRERVWNSGGHPLRDREPDVTYLPEAAWSDREQALGLKAIRENIGRLPRMELAKVNRLFLSAGQIENLFRFPLMYCFVFGALQIGMRRKLRRDCMICIALICYGTCSALVFYASDRLKITTDAVVLLIGSYGFWTQLSVLQATDLAPRNWSTEMGIWGPERGRYEGEAVHRGADHRGAERG